MKDIFSLIESGSLEKVKALIRSNRSLLNFKDKEGQTPLRFAVQESQTEIVAWLIQEGANTDIKDEDGSTLLHWACLDGNLEIVKMLINRGADINAGTKKGYTPLYVAANHGHKDSVKLLIERGADINPPCEKNRTPLIAALDNGWEEVAEILIKNNADLNQMVEDGYTLLFYAVALKNEALIKLLIKYGADTEMRDRKNRTPLMMALEKNLKKEARTLIINNVDVNARWPGEDVRGGLANAVPLHFAADEGDFELARLLIDNGAELSPRNNIGNTPLHEAISNGHKNIVGFLLDKKVDINEKGYENWTPLFHAIVSQHEILAEILINRGADINIGSEDGETPLYQAVMNNLKKILQLLIRNGAEVNTRLKNDMTPLHLAAVLGYRDIADILLNNGAELDAKTKDGWTALKLAVDFGWNELSDFFIEKGADPTIIGEIDPTSRPSKMWEQAAWKSEEGELPEDVISRIISKYVRNLDELRAVIDGAPETIPEGNTVILSNSKTQKEAVEHINKEHKGKVSFASTNRPYTAHLVEHDSPFLALTRYKLLQQEKMEMSRALIARNLAQARIQGYSDKEIDEKSHELIHNRYVSSWGDSFAEWMNLEYEKIKILIRVDPSPKHIKCLEELFFSDEIEFFDIDDVMDFLVSLPDKGWEGNFLQMIEKISFEKIWEKNGLVILDYWEQFSNKMKLNEILNSWEKQLSQWLENDEIKDHFSVSQLFNELIMGIGPEKMLQKLRGVLIKLAN